MASCSWAARSSLFATDVCSAQLGLHALMMWLLQVDMVVCFDTEATPLRNIQRMGRTGRHKQGRVVYILSAGREQEKYRKGQQASAI